MSRFAVWVALTGCVSLLAMTPASAESSSEGRPHKWETVQKGMP
jgi:hypothetical protein